MSLKRAILNVLEYLHIDTLLQTSLWAGKMVKSVLSVLELIYNQLQTPKDFYQQKKFHLWPGENNNTR